MDPGFQLTPAEKHAAQLCDRRIWLSFCLLPDQLIIISQARKPNV